MTEELLQEKAALSARWREIKNIEEEEKEDAALPALKEKYDNTYWRFLNSSGNSGVWWMYICVEKVIGALLLDKEWSPTIAGWSFQLCKDEEVRICTNDVTPGIHLLQERVTKELFMQAYQQLLVHIGELPNRTNPMHGAIATSAL